MRGYYKNNAVSPWRLSPREAQFMDALLQFGSVKGASRSMGVTPKSGEQYGHLVSLKMGEVSALKKAVAWARWRDQTSGRHAV